MLLDYTEMPKKEKKKKEEKKAACMHARTHTHTEYTQRKSQVSMILNKQCYL